MNIEHLNDNGTDIAVISSDEKLIVDTHRYAIRFRFGYDC